MSPLNRREFLKRAALTGAATLVASTRLESFAQLTAPKPQITPTPASPPPKSLVILGQNDATISQFVYHPPAIESLTDRAIGSCLGVGSAALAMKKLVTPKDIVGIKVFSTPGPVSSTNKSMLKVVVNALKAAGVPSQNIIIWDKFRFDLEAAHFVPTFQQEINSPVLGTSPDTGYADEPFYDFEVTGTLIWGDRDFNTKKATFDLDGAGNSQLSTKSYFSRIVSQRCTKLINMPSLTDHPDFGICGCLFNMAVGSVDNSRRFGVAPYFGVPPIPEIYSYDMIQKKTILNIMDALMTSYAGGPGFNANFTEQSGEILVSQDPVAIDFLCLNHLLALRKARSIPTASSFGAHVQACANYGLGYAEMQKINLRRI